MIFAAKLASKILVCKYLPIQYHNHAVIVTEMQIFKTIPHNLSFENSKRKIVRYIIYVSDIITNILNTYQASYYL